MKTLPSFKGLNLKHTGNSPFGKHFQNKERGTESVYSSRGNGNPIFTFRGKPMFFVSGSRFGVCAHHSNAQVDAILDNLKSN